MTWFKDLRTVTKLMLSFGFVTVLLAAVGYQGVTGLREMNEKVATLYQRDMAGLAAIKDVALTVAMIGRHTRGAFVYTDPSSVEQEKQKVESLFVALNESLALAGRCFVTERGRALLAELKKVIPEYHSLCSDTIRLATSGNRKEALDVVSKAIPAGNRVNSLIKEAAEMKSSFARETFQSGQELYDRARTTTIGIVLIAIGVAVGLGYSVAQLVLSPLRRTVAVLEMVAAGDLSRTAEVSTRDEVGQMATALNRALAAMRDTMSKIRRAADQIASASRQLAASSEQLSSGAQEQASSIEETSASLEQITTTVKQNADNAHHANQLTGGSRETAEQGGHIVAATQSAMGEINASSKKIADIISTVDEIAFQTNLLALNAAVEAARAGDQGRGFAVVAGEVRNLAQRSALAAKEIKTLIQDSVRKVESGTSLVDRSGETLQQIITGARRVTDIVSEISAASSEQVTGVSQIGQAMRQMDHVTQANVAQTEELNATAQNLSDQAQRMQELVAHFKLGNEGP
jgi:methyl-accepting chemotaxis protein